MAAEINAFLLKSSVNKSENSMKILKSTCLICGHPMAQPEFLLPKIIFIKCKTCRNKIKYPSVVRKRKILILGDDFCIISKIGKGSSGTVFKAWQISLQRYVAVKVLNLGSANNDALFSFLYEARVSAAIENINIVKFISAGDDNGIYYIAAELIEGTNLRDLIKVKGRLTLLQSCNILIDVANGLCAGWNDARIIHRDIKPENIIVKKDGSAVITDIGTAINQWDWNSKMRPVGSPDYMSYNQYTGTAPSCNFDIYNLGITFYEMLTGVNPLKSKTLQDTVNKHINLEENLFNNTCEISKEVQTIIKTMICIDNNKKYFHPSELIDDLKKL